MMILSLSVRHSLLINLTILLNFLSDEITLNEGSFSTNGRWLI